MNDEIKSTNVAVIQNIWGTWRRGEIDNQEFRELLVGLASTADLFEYRLNQIKERAERILEGEDWELTQWTVDLIDEGLLGDEDEQEEGTAKDS